MTVAKKYLDTSENAIASYDFFDLSARTGYKSFYALVNNEGKSLITSTLESNTFRTISTSNQAISHSYDFTFNAPAIIKGDSYTSITYEIAGSGGTSTLSGTVMVKKVDVAGNETTIGNLVTTDTLSTGAATESKRVSVTIPITKTHFSIGEKLRLACQYTTFQGAVGSILRIYHDPANRSSSGIPSNEENTSGQPSTQLKFDVPFVIDL